LSSCYNVTFETGIGFNTVGPNGKTLKSALNANRKTYSFNQKSSSIVVGASKEEPYIEILIEPANRRHDNYLARAIISIRGYLDLPHNEEIAMRIPLKLPLDLAPENLIPFVKKTIANCSNKPICFDN